MVPVMRDFLSVVSDVYPGHKLALLEMRLHDIYKNLCPIYQIGNLRKITPLHPSDFKQTSEAPYQPPIPSPSSPNLDLAGLCNQKRKKSSFPFLIISKHVYTDKKMSNSSESSASRTRSEWLLNVYHTTSRIFCKAGVSYTR